MQIDPNDIKTLDEFLAWAEATREHSLMEEVAQLSKEEQEAVLSEVDAESLLYDWSAWGRPSQILPDSEDWATGILMAGRGWGKTRCGAEWIRRKAKEHPGCRIILLGRTAADVRDVMVSGESGIMAISPPSERPEHFPSRRALEWPNGSQALLATSQDPSVLRGPQAHYAWADEIGTYTHIPDEAGLTSWQNLRIATRLGEHPQIITTTTPKRIPVIQALLDEVGAAGSKTILIRGRTVDNVGALARSYLETLWALYRGSPTLWRQEVMGELVDAVDGALWTDKTIGDARALTALPALPYRVVAVDPSVSATPRDECGIVVVGATAERQIHKRHAYILEDATVLGPPDVWARRVVEAAVKWRCPVVAEGNQGGDLVRMTIQSINPDVQVFQVTARVNKQLRAEPVVAAYHQSRVHHVGWLTELESQMTSWIPEETKKSPDRVDAAVYGITSLLIQPPKGMLQAGPLRAKSAAGRKMSGVRDQARTTPRRTNPPRRRNEPRRFRPAA